MRKQTVIAAVLTTLLFALNTRAVAAPGDLFVQVDLGNPSGCSILRVTPEKQLSEWVSNNDIIAAGGLSSSPDCDDTALVVTAAGVIYFSEDEGDHIYKVSPTGDVEIFVNVTRLADLINTSPDIDNGMALGPDGHLYVADEDCDCVIRVTLPDGDDLRIVVPESKITAATGADNADLEGGIAIDVGYALFIADDVTDSIIRVSSAPGPAPIGAGEASVYTRSADIENVTGGEGVDLDVGQVWYNDLYVLDDSTDALLKITGPGPSGVELLASQQTLEDELPADQTFEAEGGVAVGGSSQVYLGSDSYSNLLGRVPNIMRVDYAGNAELFVGASEIVAFYQSLYPGNTGQTYRLEGSMAIQRSLFSNLDPTAVPLAPLWAIAALCIVLSGLALRRFAQVRPS